ncbi:MAG TPA: DUF1501 domain-containing protein [Kiritimatiellia bacterium]|nr:DUF1501 domain-containing protein [Kiritimatiellia bacterium]
MDAPLFRSRREFLRTTLLGGAVSWTVPGFLHATISSLTAHAADAALPVANGKDGTILVVLQLAGGNDGLNTVIPVENDFYYEARPHLAIAKDAALRLADGVGLHPSLPGLKSLYDDGLLSIVQGVGYPNPNRSHFRSMEIWQTASDANRAELYGWIGRFFDNQCAGLDASAGVAFGNEAPQSFTAQHPKGVTFASPRQFRRLPGGMNEQDEELFQRMNNMSDGAAGGSIDSLAGGHNNRHREERPIDFLERTALDAQVSSDRIRKLSNTATKTTFPGSKVGRDMELIAKLIGGGMPTRVYYVSHGGFDTHANQLGSHERLLREFGDAMKAFMDEMKAQGNHQRVAVLGFSEFGRRVAENASNGTDHGAAAPVFIAGGRFPAGLHGAMPSLEPGQLDRGDLRHAIDFRSVYATLLEGHLAAPSAPILGRAFPLIGPASA